MPLAGHEDIVVASVGLVTPLGLGASAAYEALLAGASVCGVGRAPVEDAPPDRVTDLGRRAAAEALGRVGWTPCERADSRTALIVGTSKGPVDRWLDVHTTALSTRSSTSDNAEGRSCSRDRHPTPWLEECPSASAPDARLWRSAGVHAAIGLQAPCDALASYSGIDGGPRLTVSAACASGLVALVRGVMMLRDGTVDRALVVATESSLHPLFIGSFRRLGVLARDGAASRPFDRHRNGFHISEAAAAVCLERRAPKAGEVCVDRFALGGDAHHLTGVDPKGRALRACLARAVDGRPVDLVHAHGTATELNDPIELSAVQDTLAEASERSRPVVYSHKAAIGHSLGAAGLVSVVLSCLMHGRGRVPGNIHTTAPINTAHVQLHQRPVEARITRSLSIAAGFGGATAAVSLISR